MKLLTLVIFGFVVSLDQPAYGSSYNDNFVGIEVQGYKWGFWRIVDVPLDGDLGHFPIGSEELDFVTYWCLGFGSHAYFAVTQGLGAGLLFMGIILVTILVYRKRMSPNKIG